MSHSLCVWTPLRYNTQPSPLRHNTRQGLLIKVRGLRRLRLAGDRLEDGQKARLNSELVHLRTHESGSISRTLTAPDRDAPSSPSLSIGPSSHGMAWEAFEPRPPAREGQQKTRLRSPPVCPRTHRNAIDLSLLCSCNYPRSRRALGSTVLCIPFCSWYEPGDVRTALSRARGTAKDPFPIAACVPENSPERDRPLSPLQLQLPGRQDTPLDTGRQDTPLGRQDTPLAAGNIACTTRDGMLCYVTV